MQGGPAAQRGLMLEAGHNPGQIILKRGGIDG